MLVGFVLVGVVGRVVGVGLGGGLVFLLVVEGGVRRWMDQCSLLLWCGVVVVGGLLGWVVEVWVLVVVVVVVVVVVAVGLVVLLVVV